MSSRNDGAKLHIETLSIEHSILGSVMVGVRLLVF